MNSTKSDEDVDLKELICKEDMECAFCRCLWIANNPRCLPCKTVIHIFCSECLEKWGKSKSFENGGYFSCPICQQRYKWTREGINSFPRLGIFQNFLEKKISSSTFKESRVKYPRSDVEKILISYLKDTNKDMNTLINQIKEEVINSIIEIRKKEKHLIDEIKDFCQSQEDGIRNLLEKFENLQYSLMVSDENLENMTKLKMELTNKAANLLNKKLHFQKKQNGNLGEFYTIEHFQEKNPIIQVIYNEKVHNVIYYENRLYLIVENSTCKYKLILYDVKNNKSEILKRWNTFSTENYKLAASLRLYFLVIGRDEIKYLNTLPNQSYTLDVFCCIDKKIDKMSYYHNMIEYDEGIIVCTKCDDISSIAKLKDPFKVDWETLIQKDFGLAIDLAANDTKIFVCTDILKCLVLDFSTGAIISDCNFRINGSIPLSINDCSSLILNLKKNMALFKVFNVILSVNIDEKTMGGAISTTKSYKDIFDLYTSFTYKIEKDSVSLVLIRDDYVSLITIR